MIPVTRLSGRPFLLNAELIERVDSTPDTVITMMDGKQYVVSESPQTVLDSTVAYQARVSAAASRPQAKGGIRVVR